MCCQVPNPSICDSVTSSGKAVVVAVTGQTVTFDAGAGPETVRMPDGIVTFSADASTTPTTSVDAAGAWQVRLPVMRVWRSAGGRSTESTSSSQS